MQALNYSTQAIVDLRRFAAIVHDQWPYTAAGLIKMAEQIASSHKFMLPVDGFLFDSTAPSALDVFHLPFKNITVEFATTAGGRSILNCCECEREGKLGAEIWGIDWIHSNDMHVKWLMDATGVHVAYGQSPIPLTDTLRHSIPDTNVNLTPFSFKKQFLMFYEYGTAMHDKDPDGTERKVLGNAPRIIQLCAALKCSNVSTERLDPPVKLQAKRAKEGKLPLFSYHILTVGNANPSAHGNPVGSHSSPRTHLRRGHIRNHPTAGFVWVQSCVVNPGAKGSVNKDYAVTSRRAVMEALKC